MYKKDNFEEIKHSQETYEETGISQYNLPIFLLLYVHAI